MKLFSDDLDLAGMSDEELAAAWDLWFDLAQATNDFDPPWTHGVFAGIREWRWEPADLERKVAEQGKRLP